LVAVTQGDVVGVAKTHIHPDPEGSSPAGNYLGGVVVAPGFRRRGVGLDLTRARLDWIWPRASTAYYFTKSRPAPRDRSVRIRRQRRQATKAPRDGTSLKNSSDNEWALRAGSTAITSLRRANLFLMLGPAGVALFLLGLFVTNQMGPSSLPILWTSTPVGVISGFVISPIGSYYSGAPRRP